MRQFMKEYFCDYNKKERRNYAWLGVVIGLCNYQIKIACDNFSGNELALEIIRIVLLFSPIVTTLCALNYHNLHLPKMMNLAPVSDEKKVGFLKKKYLMKFGINAGLGVLVSVSMLIWFHYEIYAAGLMIWEFVVFGLLIRPEIDQEREAKYERSHIGYYYLFFSAYLLSFCLNEADPIEKTWELVLFVVVTVLQAVVLVRHLVYVKNRIQKEVSYC